MGHIFHPLSTGSDPPRSYYPRGNVRSGGGKQGTRLLSFRHASFVSGRRVKGLSEGESTTSRRIHQHVKQRDPSMPAALGKFALRLGSARPRPLLHPLYSLPISTPRSQ